MTKKYLLQLGILSCLLGALLCIPLFIVLVMIQKSPKSDSEFYLISMLNTISAIFILISLKIVIEDILRRKTFIKLINMIIAIQIIQLLEIVIDIFFPQFKNINSIFGMMIAIGGTILAIYLFVKLRKVKNIIGNLWNIYCLLEIVYNIFEITIVLIPIAILLDVIINIINAVIFYKSKKILFPSSTS
jgi:hypothetical protein